MIRSVSGTIVGVARGVRRVRVRYKSGIYDTLPGIGDGAFVIGTGSSPDKAFTSASLAFYTGDTLVVILLSFHPATRNPIPQVTNLAKAVAPLTPR